MPAGGGYSELARNRPYLLFQSSATAAAVGYSVYAISVPWLTLRLTGNLLFVGIVLFEEYGIYTLTFLVAPFVDRAPDQRWVFLATYPFMAIAAAAIGILLGRHQLTTTELVALIAAISALWDFAWAASNVVPPMLLGPDQLFRGQGLGSLLGGTAQIGGYAAGAALLVLIGPSGGMLLYAGLLAVAAACVAPVALRPKGVRTPVPYRESFREGWTLFRWSSPGSLLPLGVAEFVRGLFVAGPALVITVVAATTLAGSTFAYSAMFTAWIVGGIASGLLLGELNPRGRVGRVLLGGCLLEGTGIFAAAWFSPSLFAGAAFWLVAGAAGTAYLSALYAYIQGAHPEGSIGRTFANLYVFTGVGSALGALLLSAIGRANSPILLGGVIGLGLVGLGLAVAASPRVRELAF